MESLFEIIEFFPDSPVVFPEGPKESLGFIHKCGFYKYSSEEGKDIVGVKKDGYTKAEYFSGCGMHEGVDNYLSNPSPDYNIGKIIFAGKEHSTKFITEAKDAGYNDMVNDLEKINQSTDIDSVFLKDLDKKNVRFFVGKIISKKINQ